MIIPFGNRDVSPGFVNPGSSSKLRPVLWRRPDLPLWLRRSPLTGSIALAFCLILILLATVTQSTCEAQARWPDERTAGVFWTHATFSLEEHGELFAELARLQDDVSKTLGVARSREPIHIYLFGERKTYTEYLKQYFPSVPYRKALFIKGRGPGMVFAFANSDFAADVRHESTHAVLHASLPLVPLWLDEGLAEYFEMPSELRSSGNPHQRLVKWKARLGGVPNIKLLEAKRDLSEMTNADYRDSWAWVHFMLHGPKEAHDELVSYLADIQANTPPGVLSERLERKLPDVNARFAEHFRTWR